MDIVRKMSETDRHKKRCFTNSSAYLITFVQKIHTPYHYTVPWQAREDYTINTTIRTVLYFDSDTTATAGSNDVTCETETGCDSDVERHVERSQWTAITRLQPSATVVYRLRGGPTLDIKQGTPYK
jgi:hypothetical protein